MKKILFSIFCLSLLFAFLFVLTGCSSKPVYMEKSKVLEIVEYNFGDKYKLIDESSYPDTTEEHNTMYEYKFQNSKGNTFSMFSGTSHGGEPFSSFYQSSVTNNYINAKLDRYKDDIDRIFKKYFLSYENKYSYLYITIYNFKDIENVSKAIYEIKELLDLEETNIVSYDQYEIHTYLPVGLSLEVNSKSYYITCDFSRGDSQEYIKSSLENEMIDYATRFGVLDQIGATSEAMSNFHIKSASHSFGIHDQVTFYYDEDVQDYYTRDLSICLNYDKYSYNHNDCFQKLVESKGGTFSRNGWTNTWTIGNNTWYAVMTVNSKGEFENLEVTKNGRKLNLEYCLYKDEKNTIFQQAFTRKTLEEMTGLTITITNDGEVEFY